MFEKLAQMYNEIAPAAEEEAAPTGVALPKGDMVAPAAETAPRKGLFGGLGGMFQQSAQSMDYENADDPVAQTASNLKQTVGKTVEAATGESAMPLSVDYKFLEKVEGNKRTAYVPAEKGKAIENSGVTIGAGIDLGQQNAASLKAAKVPQPLIDKLKPYFGLRKDAAVARLGQKPLTLSASETTLLNRAVKDKYVKDVAAKFDKASTTGTKFADLPPAWQTVITSVAFQYGDLKTKAPRFWGQVTSGDFGAAQKNLLNFGDRYESRRKQEAELVANFIDTDGESA
mgnify:CR=1 FL=1